MTRPFFEAKELLPFSASHLFNIVADVRSYPLFLPWCLGARVRPIDERRQNADLIVGMGPLRETYTSLVTLVPYKQITASQVTGPFKQLDTIWTFDEVSAEETLVHFRLELTLRSQVTQALLGTMMKEASARMMEAFRQRAASPTRPTGF